MKYEQRKDKMLMLLKDSEIVNMQTLVENLGSSEATIRRDIVRMEKEGLIKRYWGGIKRIENAGTMRNRSLRTLYDEESDGIGRYAVKQIEPGDLIFLGSGSTTLSLIKYLDKTDKITVITNGIPQLEALHQKGIQALLLCGFYKEYSRSLVGSETSEMLGRYHFDKAFFGANGISEGYDILSADYYEDTLKTLAIRNSEKAFCLVKKEKFDRKAYYHVDRELAEEVFFVTNQPPKDAEKWHFEEDVYYVKRKELIND